MFEFENIGVPSRSYLYHLQPVGIGTPWVENLTGYFSRLAQAHQVYPRTLMIQEILPLLNKSYLDNSQYHSLSTFWAKNSPSLNGVGSFASDWVEILEALTKRSDLQFLTMLPWAEVLPFRGLIRRNLAWCSSCYEEWKDADKIIYEPLIWALDVVTVCDKHQQKLDFRCPHCEYTLPFLGAKSQPGYCAKCGNWLGMTNSPEKTEKIKKTELDWNNWVINAVGELLAAAPVMSLQPTQIQLAQNVSVCVEQVTGGNASSFAELLQSAGIQISKWSVWDWQKGRQLPQLYSVVHLCDFLGITPLQLLTSENIVIPSSRTKPLGENVVLPAKSKFRSKTFRADRLRRGLERVNDANEYPPPSMTQVADRLEHDKSHLVKLFPELCQPIVNRHKAHLRDQSQIRKNNVRAEIRQAIQKIHLTGQYPSMRQVRKLLSNPNLMRLTEAQETWRQTLINLGLL